MEGGRARTSVSSWFCLLPINTHKVVEDEREREREGGREGRREGGLTRR